MSEQLKIDFDAPLLSGRGWRTMTTRKRAQSKLLEMMMIKHNRHRRMLRKEPVGVAEMLIEEYGMTLAQWCRKKFDIRNYYEAISRYKNHKNVLK